MHDVADLVHAFVSEQPQAKTCFERAAAFASEPLGAGFRAAYAGAGRRLGGAARLSPKLPAELGPVGRSHLCLLDWTRAALLGLALGDARPKERESIVRFLFERGEIGEQESLLRTLSLLPDAGRYVEVALLGVRANASRIFEAIACENPYPRTFFDDPSFNQMVLKALFCEVAVRRIEGLRQRSTPELVRMVEAYRSERRAAGRSVPADAEFVLGGPGS